MTRWIGGISRLFADKRFARKLTSTSDPAVTDDTGDGYRPGDVWVNTASGNVFDNIAATVGAAIWQHRPRTWQSNAQVALTGTTAETKLASVLIPAAAMGANGVLDIEHSWINSNDADDKTRGLKFGAADDLTGTAFMGVVATTNIAHFNIHRVMNNNSVSAQKGIVPASATGGPGSFAGAAVTAAINTAAASYVVFAGTLEDGADSMSLESYKVTLTRPNIGP